MAMRALVVDDSKSARAFLARLLEEQQIEVDAAETAEQAIEYLGDCRPDVIFMDHLMPGMDGFQAVQAIKSNPRTANIPILMYTSQEGELYLGQARALGAAGVVQKSMNPADVRALLQDLGLVPGALAVSVPAVQASAPQLAETPAEMSTTPEQAPATSGFAVLLKDEVDRLRGELASSLQSHSDQMLKELRNLRAAIPAAPVSAPVLAPPPVTLPEKPRHSPVPWLLAVAASVAAATLGTLWWQGKAQLAGTSSELMDSRSTVALLTARLAPARSADVVVSVPFGEAPLAGARVDVLREFVARIGAQSQAGSVEVRHVSGRFCLAGSSTSGFALADAALPAGKCDLVVDAADPLLGAPPVEAAAFASALAELRKQYPQLTIDVAPGDGKSPGHAYPDTSDGKAPTAGEWNAVALVNNRVEIRWHPAQ